MKPFKSLVFAGIFAGLFANPVYADDIEDVAATMTVDNAVEITISGTLTVCDPAVTDERLITSVTGSAENNLYTLNLLAEPEEDESCLENVPFEVSHILPADCQATDLLVQLISGVDENDVPLIKDSEDLPLEVPSEEVCTDDCADELVLCTEECDAACAEECEEDDTVCLEACVAPCHTDCQTASDECLVVCEESETTISCTPDTLNLKSNGRWVTCLVESINIVDIEDVATDSFMLNGTFLAEKACMQEDLLMLKFSRPDLIDSLLPADDDEETVFPMEIDLLVTGSLSDGSPIEGTDSLRVINPEPQGKQVKTQKKTQKKVQNKVQNKGQNAANKKGKK